MVFPRLGYNVDLTDLTNPNIPKKSIIVEENSSLIGMISSTEVTQRVRESRKSQEKGNKFLGISGLVTPGVIDYINEFHLYN